MRKLAVALAVLVFLAPAAALLRAGRAVEASFPDALPATFAGDLPCADCPGIRLTLELLAEHVFVYRLTYQGRGEGGRGESVALERGYLSAAPKPGEAVLVTLVGQIAMRPPMEGTALRRSLVPLRFVSASPRGTCEEARGGLQAEPLDGTAWQLASASLPVAPPTDVAAVTLKFKEGRVSAASGCNTGVGSYSEEGGSLTVGLLAATRKACPGELDAWEPAFFAFLGANPAMERTGDELVLTSGGQVLRFRALPVASAGAVTKFIYVAAERKPCTEGASTECLQVREHPSDPWRLHHGEIIGFTPEPGIEYRLRILEDETPNPPADGSSKRWFLDLVVEQRVVGR
ncbi:MAG: META domain-containing protein [Acidobacteria bacterium]|nr:META domain-containing protein [Acidobacteriota bacterium]